MKRISLITACILVLLVVGLGFMTPNASAVEYHLRAAHQLPRDFAWQDGLEYFAEKVYEYTDGNVEVSVYGDAVLGQEQDYYQNMMMGVLDFAVAAPAWAGTFAEELEFLSVPFLFKNRDHWQAAVDGEVGAEIAQIAEEAIGLKILGYWGGSDRNLLSRVGPIAEPEDLDGFLIRVMDSPIQVETWSSVGASPSPMAYEEVYSGLQQGVIDGMENETATLYNMRFYEVADSIALTQHTFTVRPLWMSGDTWDKLPEEYREAIQKAADEATEFVRELEWQQNDEAAQIMEEEYGIEMVEFEQSDWLREQTEHVRVNAAEEMGATHLLELLEEMEEDY